MANWGWLPLLITGVLGLGGSVTAAALVTAFMNRGKTRAEAGKIITDQSVVLVNELQEEVKAARVEAGQAREEANQARTEVRQIRDEARAIAAELYELRTAVFRPDVTIAQLQELARNPTPAIR